jgi:YegS/Rv2252/BmrU family lipid kinase
VETLTLIMNPESGTRLGRRILPDLISLFNRAGFLCTAYMTEKRGDAAEFLRLHGGETGRIVVCGGDGTLNEAVTGLMQGGHTTPLAYIPCGSTNDFANGLGIPGDWQKAAEIAVSGTPRALDLGRFGQDRYFTYTASFGAFTQVAWSTPQQVKNMLGHVAYVLEGIRSLPQIKPIRMNIRANGLEYEDDYLFGGVCNSTIIGGGILRLRESEVHMSDGMFEAILVTYPGDILVLNRILTCLNAGRYDDPNLLFLRAPDFVFSSKSRPLWTVDGEVAETGNSVTVRNLHQSFRIFLPE